MEQALDRRWLTWTCAAALVLCSPFQAHAQCEGWMDGAAYPGINGSVVASAIWDADGPGPAQPVLVVGGRFTVAGNIRANSVATWNGQEWSPLGSGFDRGILSLAVTPSGGLYVVGERDDQPSRPVSRWDGSVWQNFGDADGDFVSKICPMPDGGLAAHGYVLAADGSVRRYVKRWDGSSWTNLGGDVEGGFDAELMALPGGDLLVAGAFTSIGGVALNRIARWDGAAWVPMGAGFDDAVYALARMPNGDIIAAGNMRFSGTTPLTRIARWNGVEWSPMPVQTDWAFRSLAAASDGSLYVGSHFVAGGASAASIKRWNGMEWSDLGYRLTAPISTMTLVPASLGGSVGPEMLVIGTDVASYLASLLDGGARSIARWDGTTWRSLGVGTSGYVSHLLRLPDGDVIAAGGFVRIEGTPAMRIARWDGQSWHALADGPGGSISAIAHVPGVGLVASGSFYLADGTRDLNIKRWDGAAWLPFTTGTNNTADRLFGLADGTMVAAGNFAVAGSSGISEMALWNGQRWISMGWHDRVIQLVQLPSGEMILDGVARNSAGIYTRGLFQWNGASWQPLGTLGTQMPSVLYVAQDGFLYALLGSQLVRWNGAAWMPIAQPLWFNPTLVALRQLPSGKFVAIDQYGEILLLDGERWSLIPGRTDSTVQAVCVAPSGDVMLGGGFASANDHVSAFLARWKDPIEPRITQQPVGGVVCTGADISVRIAVDSARPAAVTYEWSLQTDNGGRTRLSDGLVPWWGVTISGATTPVLEVRGIRRTFDTFGFSCIVRDGCEVESINAFTWPVPCCSADIDESGDVTGDDLFTFLDAWITLYVYDSRGLAWSPADFVRDNRINTDDLFGYIDAWFGQIGSLCH